MSKYLSDAVKIIHFIKMHPKNFEQIYADEDVYKKVITLNTKVSCFNSGDSMWLYSFEMATSRF